MGMLGSDMQNEMLLHIGNEVWYVNLNGLDRACSDVPADEAEAAYKLDYIKRRERCFCAPLNRNGREQCIFALQYRHFMRYGKFIMQYFGDDAVEMLAVARNILMIDEADGGEGRIRSGKYDEDKRKIHFQHDFRQFIWDDGGYDVKMGAGEYEFNNKFVGCAEYIVMDLPDYSFWDLNNGSEFFEKFGDWVPGTFTKVYFMHSEGETRAKVLKIFIDATTVKKLALGQAGYEVKGYEKYCPDMSKVGDLSYIYGENRRIVGNPLFGDVDCEYFDLFSGREKHVINENSGVSVANYTKMVEKMARGWMNDMCLPYRYILYRRVDGVGKRNLWRFLDLQPRRGCVKGQDVENYKILYADFMCFRKFGYRIPKIVGYSYDENYFFGRKDAYSWEKLSQESEFDEVVMTHIFQNSYFEDQFSGLSNARFMHDLPELFNDSSRFYM